MIGGENVVLRFESCIVAVPPCVCHPGAPHDLQTECERVAILLTVGVGANEMRGAMVQLFPNGSSHEVNIINQRGLKRSMFDVNVVN